MKPWTWLLLNPACAKQKTFHLFSFLEIYYFFILQILIFSLIPGACSMSANIKFNVNLVPLAFAVQVPISSDELFLLSHSEY